MSEGGGSYLEDRALIFDRLNRLEMESVLNRELIGEFKATQRKFNQDLNEAHSRLRGLIGGQDSLGKRFTEMRVRAGYIAAGAGATVGLVTAMVIEGVKWLLHR